MSLREEFEVWALKDFGLRAGHFVKDSDGEYLNYPTQCYFQVWRASREALEIELPPTYTESPGSRHQVMDASNVIEVLQAAGVRVKP